MRDFLGRCLGGVWLCLLLGVGSVAGAQEMSGRELLEFYDAAYEAWYSKLTFKCTYVFQDGTAKSWEEGLEGKFDKVHVSGKGKIVKTEQQLRCSKLYDGGQIAVEGSPNTTTNSSWDILAKRDVYFQMQLDNRSSSLAVRNDEDRVRLNLQSHGHPGICALTVSGAGALGSPFGIALRNPRFTIVEATASELKDEHVILSITMTLGDENVKEKVHFWMSPEGPVVDRIENENVGKEHRSTRVNIASDFRKCQAGYAPAKVISVSKSHHDKYPQYDSISLKTWTSKDLGKSAPSDKDFLVSIPANTGVDGIKDYVSTSKTARTLDFNQLSEANIGVAGEVVPVAKESSRWLFKTLFVGLVVVGAVYVVWKRVRG